MQISCDVTIEQYNKKKEKNLKWNNIIADGLSISMYREEVFSLRHSVDDLTKELNLLKADHIIRGKKLQKYIEKYGLDEDIIYKFKEEV
jgi:hypothetical protein